MTPLSAKILPLRLPVIGRYHILEELYRGSESRVCRARNAENGQLVILKICQDQALVNGGLARYKNELIAIQAIAGNSVVRCLGLEQVAGAIMLVFEDTGAQSLHDVMAGGALPLGQALRYAARIAAGLNEIHAAHVIHKDINPHNIVVNDASGDLTIIDFGASSRLSREQQTIVAPNVLAGTLTYISPEQTGRMNRAIDYRCDFYSFGATLYEMLTGRPPFTAYDPLDLVHLHIAKHPVPPRDIDPNIPKVVSDIVLRLLAKTAEDRYQSAFGIKADLDECLTRLDDAGAISTFPLATHDRPHQFRIPQILYGREHKVEHLLQHFDAVTNGGRKFVLIGGYSGIGKSSLVHEIYKPITERRGYFVAGKFNQFQRGAPLEPLFDALRELIQQILTENEERIAYWRKRLLDVLGASGQLVRDVFPEIEFIIGPQPPVPELGPTETQNRLNLVFGNFIHAFCDAKHPLVLFLDDLQWIDSASLAFLLRLLKDESIHHLMIVGTYRNNEVDQTHPLMVGLQNYKNGGGAIDTIVLEPLKIDHVRQLVSDTLRCHPAEAKALAELVTQKTDGNPFFIEEFLKSLYADELLSFDTQHGRWTWDLQRIQTHRMTDNVADLMAAKLERLDPETKHALSLAACLGKRFDLLALAAIYQQSPAQTLAALRPALEKGLIDPIGAVTSWLLEGGAISDQDARRIECRFSHDRFQDAAYALIPNAQKPAMHHSIGTLLLASTAEHDLDDKVFDIVSHFALGIDCIVDDKQFNQLAELILRLAQAAKYSGANDTAFEFLKIAIDRLPDAYWQRASELSFQLHAAGAAAAQASGRYEDMELLCRVALAHAQSPLDKLQIHEIEAGASYKRTQFLAVVARGVEALKLIGFRLPAKPTALHVWWSGLRIKWALFGKSDDELLGMTATPDPASQAQRRLSVLIEGAAYWTNPHLLAVNNFETIRAAVVSRQQLSAGRLAAYGMIMTGMFDDMNGGYRYGALALRMANQPGYEQERSRTYGIYYANVHHRKRPARESLPGLFRAYEYGLEFGQHIFAAAGILGYCYLSFHCGKELAALDEEFTQYDEVIKRKLQCLSQYEVNALFHQALLNLRGKSDDPCSLSGITGEEAESLRRWEATAQFTTLHTYHFLKQLLAFYFGRYEDAVQFADRARGLERYIIGTLTVPVAVFYDSLARLAIYPTARPRRRQQILAQVRRNQKRMADWARHAPANHRHKFLLVQAELARIRGREIAAMDAYEQAIGLAHKNEYVQEEGLANELAAKFHVARGTHSIAATYLRQAIACYRKWGADAKVEELCRSYAPLVPATEAATIKTPLATDVGSGVYASNFDLRALVKALKGIAEEKSHSELLQKTLLTAMEVAGADAGALILRKSIDALFVEAEVSLDDHTPRILQSTPVDGATNVCEALVNYVKRTGKSVVVRDARHAKTALHGVDLDPYMRRRDVKSMLCIPLIIESAPESERLIGLLYLENKQAANTFDEQRFETLGIICLAATGRLELSRKAMTDGLTGLYNHDAFQNLLQKEFSAAQRAQQRLSVIMIDIDNFKAFNDQWGHPLGDAVLAKVAAVMRNACRQSDVVARYGGEEMAVILPNTDSASARIVAERIREYVETGGIEQNGSLLSVTVSVGVATSSSETRGPMSLVKLADQALYESKHAGRNRVSVK